MPSLAKLPAELLDCILDSCDKSTVSRVSRTSVHLYAATKSRLYNSIDWFWAEFEPSPPVHLLLRSLMNNPSLQIHVKTLHLRGGSYSRATLDRLLSGDPDTPYRLQGPECCESFSESFSLEEIRRLRTLSLKLALPMRRRWISEFQKGSMDVMLALLLHHVPAIKQLDLGYEYLHRAYFLPAMLRYHLLDSKVSKHFTSLSKVSLAADISRDVTGFSHDLDFLRPLFRLPAVESISIVVREPIIFTWPGKLPLLPNLSTLVLNKCCVPEKVLQKILSCTPALRHLTYSHYHQVKRKPRKKYESEYPIDCPRFSGWNLIDCGLFSDALSHVKNTLETLVLTIRYWEKVNFEEELDVVAPCIVVDRITSIRTMPRLTFLEIPWVFLFGWRTEVSPCWTECLPPSIQDLRIRDDMREFWEYLWTDENVMPRVKELVDLHSQVFLELRTVCFIHTYIRGAMEYSSSWYDERFEGISALFRSTSLICTSSNEVDFTPITSS